MVTPLSPAARRQIIAFDPADPDAVSVTAFCKSMKISRRSFYTIRARHMEESQGALHPRSSAPHNTQRKYDETVTRVLLEARADLKSDGWDYGPMSIRFEIAVNERVGPPIPSVSTIARLLRAAGAVEANPKKRPKSSYIRFQRDQAMAMWQIDAFEYRLHDRAKTKVTIYQVIDDATRKDVGTAVFADHENSVDAMAVMKACIGAFGAPHEVLSDNQAAFNQLRQGRVGPMEQYLASQGTLAISGRQYHPQTQGKNERSHRTLHRYLEAHQPTSLEAVHERIAVYREHYNHRRPHQSLPPRTTPQQTWELIDHAAPKPPLDPAVLEHKAAEYRKRRLRLNQILRQAESPPRAKWLEAARPSQEEPVEASGPQLITVTRDNPAVFFQGYRIGPPAKFANRQYYRTVSDDQLAYWCAEEGELVVAIPLPIVAFSGAKRYLNSYNIQGAWLNEPTPNWIKKHREATQKFQQTEPIKEPTQ